jgi:lysine/ornithine N-monooxygenase
MNYIEEHSKAKQHYVIDNSGQLREQYGDYYIAISSTLGILDSDNDIIALAKRMDSQFRSESVLISTIDEVLNTRYSELPSPEVEQ